MLTNASMPHVSTVETVLIASTLTSANASRDSKEQTVKLILMIALPNLVSMVASVLTASSHTPAIVYRDTLERNATLTSKQRWKQRWRNLDQSSTLTHLQSTLFP